MKKNLHVVAACIAIVALCAPAALAGDKKKSLPPTVKASPAPTANNQVTTKRKTARTDVRQLKARDLKSSNADVEAARVKKQLQEIQALPLSREEKIQKQRALLDSETVNAKEQMRELQADSKETKGASRDRKKSGLDNIQKFLDIIRSMNPQI